MIVSGGCNQKLSSDVIAAYDAPFPDESYKMAARVFPALVPTSPQDPASTANRQAWEVLRQWKKPFMTCFSDKDPITKGGDLLLQKLIPGAANQPHIVIEDGGHFVQEDKGEVWANQLVYFIQKTTI
jgi:haloalkane dehalogenase